jgi:hypothetical protein
LGDDGSADTGDEAGAKVDGGDLEARTRNSEKPRAMRETLVGSHHFVHEEASQHTVNVTHHFNERNIETQEL